MVVTHRVVAVIRLQPAIDRLMKRWSLHQLLGRQLTKLCPAVSSTTVSVAIQPSLRRNDGGCECEAQDCPVPTQWSVAPHGLELASPNPAALQLVAGQPGRSLPSATADDGAMRTVIVSDDAPLQLEVVAEGELPASSTAGLDHVARLLSAATTPLPVANAYVSVSRYLTGSELVRRGVSTAVSNPTAEATNVTLLETLPTFLRPLFHTHTARLLCGGRVTSDDAAAQSPHVQAYHVTPALLDGPATVMQLRVHVPARCTLHLSLECDVAFLSVEALPADPARGLDLPAAMAWVSSTDLGHDHTLFSESLLVRARVRMRHAASPYTCTCACSG